MFKIETLAGHETGSADSTTGHLSYLFSLVQDGMVSSGGGYYWLAGAVDSSVDTVVVTFAEPSQPIIAPLAPLASGWRGFALLYSPGPGYYAPSSTEPHGPRNAGLTVTARDHAGKAVDSRYLNLDTNEQRAVGARSTG